MLYRKFPLTEQEKLKALIGAGLTPAALARQIEVSYMTVYRWLEQDIQPHPSSSRRIDELFKRHIDLAPTVEKARTSLGDPIKALNNQTIRDRFLLEMTYHSNAIEGSRMTIKEFS